MAKVTKLIKKDIVNMTTGEVVESETTTEQYLDTEPDYVKVYLRDVIKLKDLPKGTSSVLFSLLQRMTYNNDIVISASLKREISEELGLEPRTIKDGVENLTKANILIRKDRGYYLFNPFLFGRGKWTGIKKIRVTIDYSQSGKEIKAEFNYETDAVSNS